MSKKDKQSAPTYYGGLTFKQFRNAGKIGLWMSDMAWAGRLYTKYGFWWNVLTKLVYAMLAISILSLALIWGSILLRPPVLLLGVYPDARVVCMPRILDEYGNVVQRHKSYNNTCAALFVKAGLTWVSEESKKNDGKLPSTDPRSELEDPNPHMRAPTTTVDVVQRAMLEKQAAQHRQDLRSLSPSTQRR